MVSSTSPSEARVTLRLPTELHQQLREQARRSGRSLNQAIVSAISRSLYAGETEPQPLDSRAEQTALAREALADLVVDFEVDDFALVAARGVAEPRARERRRPLLGVRLDPPLSATISADRADRIGDVAANRASVPLTYLDSSALVKRYVQEPGSARVNQLCEQETIVVSQLAVTEIASALARRSHEGTFSRGQRDELFRAFVADAKSWLVIALRKPIVQRAAAVLLDAPTDLRLRTLDALQVASADIAFRRARHRGIDVGSFVASDATLLRAAIWVGLATEDPGAQP